MRFDDGVNESFAFFKENKIDLCANNDFVLQFVLGRLNSNDDLYMCTLCVRKLVEMPIF